MKRINLTCFFLFVFGIFQVAAQTIAVADAGGCSQSSDPDMTLAGNNGGSPVRNIYVAIAGNGNIPYRVRWSAANNRWELQFDADIDGSYSYTSHFNTTATAPNPPALGLGAWIDAGLGCGALTVFSGTGTQAGLPIELVRFEGTSEGSINHLTWSTASETNAKAFYIERSADGRTFANIGQIDAVNKPATYQFVDNQPFITSYYRLLQTDLDGTGTYSKAILVTLPGAKDVKVYPTLVMDGYLTISMEDLTTADFSIYNLLGQFVQRGQITPQLDVSALPKGTYILQIGATQTKFVKM